MYNGISGKPGRLNNIATLEPKINAMIEEILTDAQEIFKGRIDFRIQIYPTGNLLLEIGNEPRYMKDPLNIITFDGWRYRRYTSNQTGFESGIAWGPYGTQIQSRFKKLTDYKRCSKYSKFIEKWLPTIESMKLTKDDMKELSYIERYAKDTNFRPERFDDIYIWRKEVEKTLTYDLYKLNYITQDAIKAIKIFFTELF